MSYANINEVFLKLIHWNIEGLKSKNGIKLKLKNPTFLSQIKGCDIIGLTETHDTGDGICELDGYKSFQSNRPKSEKANKGSGGVAILVKNDVKRGCTFYKSASTDICWLRLNKQFFKIDTDIFVGVVYVSPRNSTYSSRQNIETWDVLEKEVEKFMGDGKIILLGDFNTRIGDKSDFVNLDDTKYTPLPKNYVVDETGFRNYEDKKSYPLNFVDRLLDLCISSGIKILNGRTLGDSAGKYTCHRYNGSSTVDYAMCDISLFPLVRFFKVAEILEALSDHCPIVLALKLTKPYVDKNVKNDNEFPLPQKIIWKQHSETIFKNELLSSNCQEKIISLENCDMYKDNIDEHVTNISKLVTDAAIKAGKLSKNRNNNVSGRNKHTGNKKKWYDADCTQMKRDLQKLGKDLLRSPNDCNIRGRFFVLKKKYKKTLRVKETAFKNNLIEKLEGMANNNPKMYWKLLDDLRKNGSKNEEAGVSTDISSEEWISHYKELYKCPETERGELDRIETKIKDFETDSYFSELDFEITKEDVVKAVKSLKNGKTPGLDGISNEMLKASLPSCLKIYVKLFNTILNLGVFPKSWGRGIIVNIHKSGNRSNTGNYRGITLFSCLEKVFGTIMNYRLETFLKSRSVMSDNQIGFQKKARTTDHLFIIKTLMDKYINKEKASIYACFVDFRKAFDSIWHNGLFLKLLENGVKGKFYNVIKSLYLNSESCIKLWNGRRSDFFYCASGVKQGEPLSPTLFNLYINDLSKILDSKSADSPTLNTITISHLMYADDLVLLSLSAKGLQNSLNHLSEFCKRWKLNVNVQKTKVIKFSKCGRLATESFHISNLEVEKVKQCKYLGVVLASSGTFTYAKNNIVQRAKKALFKIKTCLGFGKISPHLGLKIFDQTVSPVCLYASEIWSSENLVKNKKFSKKWGLYEYFYDSCIEELNVSMCKFLLGVNKKAGNIAVKSELGRYPLAMRIISQCVGFWNHLHMSENTLLSNALHESKKLAAENVNSWALFFNTLCEKAQINPHNSKEIQDKLKCDYRKYWMVNFVEKYKSDSKGKFTSLVLYKDKFHYEPYLDQIKNSKHRIALTKFRLSNHNLPIERGRYTKPFTPRGERFCLFCMPSGNKPIGNEEHFLLHCPNFKTDRDIFIKSVYTNVHHLSSMDLFIYLLSSEGTTIRQVAKFCYKNLPTK